MRYFNLALTFISKIGEVLLYSYHCASVYSRLLYSWSAWIWTEREVVSNREQSCPALHPLIHKHLYQEHTFCADGRGHVPAARVFIPDQAVNLVLHLFGSEIFKTSQRDTEDSALQSHTLTHKIQGPENRDRQGLQDAVIKSMSEENRLWIPLTWGETWCSCWRTEFFVAPNNVVQNNLTLYKMQHKSKNCS